MMPKLGRVGLLVMCLGLLAALPTGAALADAPAGAKVRLSVPAEAAVGDEVLLDAIVTDASASRLAGVEVVFMESVYFLNTDDSVELGRSVTDEAGRASISYVPRSEGDIRLSAGIAGSGSTITNKVNSTVKVKPGPPQHESERTGVKVPGVGMWALAVFMAGIWAIFLWSVLQLRHVFRLGQQPRTTSRMGQPYA